MTAIAAVRTWGRMVKFSHTLFALPFAFAGATLAAAKVGLEPSRLIWVALAMFGARNAAMGFNRLVDQRFDAVNPRTADRELPAGRLGRPAVWTMTAALSALFLASTLALGLLPLGLAGLALTFGYSLTKRFTAASHLVLGAALALAPVGGWLAMGGPWSVELIGLAAGVALWVAGFDLIYACQDAEHDRRVGLHSIPARIGSGAALTLARAFHAGTLAALAFVGAAGGLHPVYWIGWGVIAAVLVHEHRLVRPDDLSRLGQAFFQSNAVVSALYLATVLLAVAAERF